MRFLEALGRASDLSEHHVSVVADLRVHARSPDLMKRGSFSHAVPKSQLFPARKAELRQRIADVKLHRVDADPHALRDAPVGEPMANLLGHSPLGGRQHVVVTGATWSAAHVAIGSK